MKFFKEVDENGELSSSEENEFMHVGTIRTTKSMRGKNK